MTPSRIKPATFRFVAQHLNHCATPVPHSKDHTLKGFMVILCTSYINWALQIMKGRNMWLYKDLHYYQKWYTALALRAIELT